MRRTLPALLPTLMLIALAAAACTGGPAARGAVTIEPIPTDTVAPPTPRTGGKAAAPPPAPTPEPSPTEAPDAAPTATPGVEPSPSPEAAGPPEEGHWIDVDVTNFTVRLMDGTSVVREIGPVGVGVEVDTGNYLSTQTGLFRVHDKVEELVYDAPFDTYISHWVGFDPAKDNGFHSFLKDREGNVVDASTGRVSNGCIRTGEPEAIFAFAEAGMPVYVHW